MLVRQLRPINGLIALVLLHGLLATAHAKDEPQTILWPSNGSPSIRFTFAKFKSLGTVANERTLVFETSAENLTPQLITRRDFKVYFFDKNRARIGDSSITLENLRPAETVKFQTTVVTAGTPASISITAMSEVPRTITITVNSVPQGADLSVDGKPVGSTPKAVTVGVGKHLLEFSMEGFRSGTFPLEIGANDTSGGSVTYELGASALDTVELRDGTVLTGDLIALTGTEVVIKSGGTSQHLERNKVKRILLTERTTRESAGSKQF
jgi:hypothetical protein